MNCLREKPQFLDVDIPRVISGALGNSIGVLVDADMETVLAYVRDQRLQQTKLDAFPTTANCAK